VASDQQVRQKESELHRFRDDLARESAKIGPAHAKASKARADGARTTSDATRRTKLAEAAREDKKASDAEQARARLDGRIATKEKELAAARRKYETDLGREQTRAMAQLRETVSTREAQFRGFSALAGTRPPLAAAAAVRTDVFISHASEDKDEIARPLAEALEARGVSVWYDELSIEWGRSIRRAIDAGIAGTRFGLVVISRHFIKKSWTQAELDGLYNRQIGEASGDGFILPLWHNITADEVQEHLPMLAGIKALNTAVFTVDQIAEEVSRVVTSR
jgi:hypothetical protein